MTRWFCFPRIALFAIATLFGCGGGDTPEIGYVEGTVTMDGKPLEGATVTFTPTGKGRPSGAITDKDGWYELTYSRSAMGALTGEHIVSIRTYKEPYPMAENPDEKQGVPEKVPAKYNARSELTETVEASDQVMDFELDSEGEIVLPPNAAPIKG